MSDTSDDVKRQDLEPIIKFECPRCGEEIEMRETTRGSLKMITKFHTPPLSEEDIKITTEPSKDKIKMLKEEGVENPREYLNKKRKEYEEDKENFCMSFSKSPERIYNLMGDLYRGKLPVVFSNLDTSRDGEKTLKAALEELKEGNFGIRIRILGSESIIGFAYIWKYQERFYGLVEGVKTPQNFIATKDFNEVKDFIDKWYNWHE